MKSDELQQLDLASLGGCSWEYDLETDQIAYSDEFFALLGYRPDELEIDTEWVSDNIHLRDLSQWRDAFVNYEQVVVYLRMRDDFAGCRAGATLLKLFRNVPKADLEMLFPNTRVRMRLMDKLLIGIPAFISAGIIILLRKTKIR